MPVINSSGESSPRSTCCKRYSHSAVRSGDWSCSGSTVMRETPVWAGTRLTAFFALLRSTKPVDTSFSMMAARVAGVPKPFRSASSGVSSLPAFSIADRRVSSVKCLGGVVLPSFTAASVQSNTCPSDSSGSAASRFSCARYRFQPVSRTVLPLAVNSVPPHSSVTVVSA